MSDSDNWKEKKDDAWTLKSLLRRYDESLMRAPLLTKSLTSAAAFGIGDLLSQLIAPKPGAPNGYQWRTTFAYTCFGGLISAPMIHWFYAEMDRLLPRRQKTNSSVSDSSKTGLCNALLRVAVDRLLLAPPYILLLYYVVPLLEGRSLAEATVKVRQSFITVMKMNIKVYTLFQFVNINCVPQKYRVLYMALLSLFWNIYMAYKRR